MIVRGWLGLGSGVEETVGTVGKSGTVGTVLLHYGTLFWMGGIVPGIVSKLVLLSVS